MCLSAMLRGAWTLLGCRGWAQHDEHEALLCLEQEICAYTLLSLKNYVEQFYAKPTRMDAFPAKQRVPLVPVPRRGTLPPPEHY
jgi:hypothetical protein